MLGFKEIAYAFKIQSNGAAIFETMEDDEAKEKLADYRKETEDFSDFLKKIYPKYLFKRL